MKPFGPRNGEYYSDPLNPNPCEESGIGIKDVNGDASINPFPSLFIASNHFLEVAKGIVCENNVDKGLEFGYNDFYYSTNNGIEISNLTHSVPIPPSPNNVLINGNRFIQSDKTSISMESVSGKIEISGNLMQNNFYEYQNSKGISISNCWEFQVDPGTPHLEQTYGIKITGNTVNGKETGIEAINTSGVHIESNYIFMNEWSFLNDQTLSRGIRIDNCTNNPFISCNSVLGFTTSAFPSGLENLFIGLEIMNSSRALSIENNITGCGRGLNFSGDCMPSYNIRNVLTENYYGIFLENAGINTLIGNQGFDAITGETPYFSYNWNYWVNEFYSNTTDIGGGSASPVYFNAPNPNPSLFPDPISCINLSVQTFPTSPVYPDIPYTDPCGFILGKYAFQDSSNKPDKIGTLNFTPFSPNPGFGDFSMKYSIGFTDKVMVEIFDIQGRKLDQINLDPKEQTLKFNAENYVQGIYFYSIQFNGNLVYYNKLVILK